MRGAEVSNERKNRRNIILIVNYYFSSIVFHGEFVILTLEMFMSRLPKNHTK